MVNISIPNGAKVVLEALNSAGFEAYVVGGCVRDSLLGIKPKDWDICTSAKVDDIKQVFAKNYIIETGIKHGTITVLKEGMPYEITTFRVDGNYSDGRHPDSVRFTTKLIEDLARRDFTINAMAYNHQTGLIDLYGGQNDLNNKLIKCVGEPDDRFSEDALRILRAVRFSAQLGFSIENNTHQSILKHYRKLNNISAERIRVELCSIITGEYALQTLLTYKPILGFIIPPLKKCIGFKQNNKFHCYTVYDHIAHAIDNYHGTDIVVKMALLLHDIGKPLCYTEDENGGHFYNHPIISHYLASKILNDLKFSNVQKRLILELIEFHDTTLVPTEKAIKRWLNRIGYNQFERLLQIKLADISAHRIETQQERIATISKISEIFSNIIENEQCFTIKDLNINGTDIISLGVKEGRIVGETLKYLLEKVIDDEVINEKDELIALARIYLSGRC